MAGDGVPDKDAVIGGLVVDRVFRGTEVYFGDLLTQTWGGGHDSNLLRIRVVTSEVVELADPPIRLDCGVDRSADIAVVDESTKVNARDTVTKHPKLPLH